MSERKGERSYLFISNQFFLSCVSVCDLYGQPHIHTYATAAAAAAATVAVVCPKPEQSRTFPYLIMDLVTYVTKAYMFSPACLLALVASRNGKKQANRWLLAAGHTDTHTNGECVCIVFILMKCT